MARSLDGTNDAFTAGSSAVNLNAGTFVAWILFDTSTGVRYLFDTDTARHAYFYDDFNNDQITMHKNGRNREFGDLFLSDDVWTHFAFLYNKTGNVQRLFIDGVEQTGETATGTWGSSSLGTNFYIGQRFNGVERHVGDIAEAATFPSVLSDAEVVTASKKFSPLLLPTKPTAYWKFIGRQSPELDIVGGFNATLVGSPATLAHPPIIYPTQPISGFAAAAVPPAVTRRPIIIVELMKYMPAPLLAGGLGLAWVINRRNKLMKEELK